MADSIFLKMARHEVPAPIIYEDELTMTILDKSPVTKGHALVFPKQQIDHIDDCPPELYQAIFATVHKVSKHLHQKLNPLRVALVVHGLEVPHAHVHIVPMYTGKELHLADRSEEVPDLVGLAEELKLL